MAFKKIDLLKQFSSESAIGVIYRDFGYDYDDNDPELAGPDDPDYEETAFLPDGFGNMSRCTNCARFVVNKLGKGDVYGFLTDNNPVESSAVNFAMGHDFAVVDNFIIDPWISVFNGEEKQSVFDMNSSKDREKIVKFYGDPEKWDFLNPETGKFVNACGHPYPEDKKISLPKLRECSTDNDLSL